MLFEMNQEKKQIVRDAQIVIQRLARGEISDDEAQRLLEQYWKQAYDEPLLRRILVTMFPALSRRNTRYKAAAAG